MLKQALHVVRLSAYARYVLSNLVHESKYVLARIPTDNYSTYFSKKWSAVPVDRQIRAGRLHTVLNGREWRPFPHFMRSTIPKHRHTIF